MRRCSDRRDPRGLTSVGLSGDVGGRLAVGLCGPLPNAVRRVVVFVLSLKKVVYCCFCHSSNEVSAKRSTFGL
jgi:hypothetical protein